MRLRGGVGKAKAPTFPLTTREAALEYIRGPNGPTVLVVFEFSGALLMRLLRKYKAMSVDLRAPEHGGPAYQGDVRDIIHLRLWDAIYFVGPNCYQHMRHDQTLQAKLDDGRAFWGGAMVLWCLCCEYAKALIMEQPDTIVFDYVISESLVGVEMIELQTRDLGDECANKFVKLIGRNFELRTPSPAERPLRPDKLQRRPAVWEHKNPDERDKARSTWLDKPNLCEYVAELAIRDPSGWPNLIYAELINGFAERWLAAGHYLPSDFDNPTGQPLSEAEKAYQQVRGAGAGPSQAAAPPAPRKGARKAEPGDQHVKVNTSVTLLQMLDRRTREGTPVTNTPELQQAIARLEGKEQRTANEVLLFYEGEATAGPQASLSNYFTVDAEFIDPDLPWWGVPLTFHSVEQYFHFNKALLTNDLSSAQQILAASTPKECRRLGQQVKGFQDEPWAAIARQVVERGVYLKFAQNPKLAEYLLGTGVAELVEASPFDARWGIGVPAHNALHVPRSRWGTNWLGHALMRVRARLRLGGEAEVEPPVPRALKQVASASKKVQGELSAANRKRVATTSMDDTGRGGARVAGASGVPLSPVMRSVAWELGPRVRVVDFGGRGNCGPLCIAGVLRHCALAEVSGEQVRTWTVEHARQLLKQRAVWQKGEGGAPGMLVQHMLEAAMRSWTPAGVRVSASRWCDLMERDGIWVDQAFLALAADLMRVRLTSHVASTKGTTKAFTYEPRPGTAAIGDIVLVNELNVHFCGVVPVSGQDCAQDVPLTGREGASKPQAFVAAQSPKDDQEAAQGPLVNDAVDHTLVPTESQLMVLLEQSREMAKLEREAVFTPEEFEAIAHALQASGDGHSSSVALAMQLSQESAEREEAAAMVLATGLSKEAQRLEEYKRAHLARQRQDAATAVPLEDLVLVEDDLDDFQSYEETWSQARAADAFGEVVRGGATNDTELVAFAEPSLTEGDTLVVPFGLEDGEPMVLMPQNPEQVHGFHGLSKDNGIVEKAEIETQKLLGLRGAVHGFTAGASRLGTRLVVVACEPRSRPIARTTQARRRASVPGVTALWCTVVALMAGSWQERVGTLAIAAATHFMPMGGATTGMLIREEALRQATGLEAGRTPYLAPTRPTLDAEGGLTCRALIEWSEESIPRLKRELSRQPGAHASYYRGWADAAKPLMLAEVSEGALDQVLAIADDKLKRELFSPPLPVYETPWLERAPPQVWAPLPGCEDFVAQTAADLIHEDAKAELRAWVEDARRDAACLEEWGADCDRKHKPPNIAIGQAQTHRCARDYVWDCRESPCRLLDYTTPISTDWNLNVLKRRFQGYPDQRLASNAVEGVRLEADVELVSVFNAQLSSIGAGYDSVQKTVRELRDMGFYDFFLQLAFWPIIVIGQGSRIKALGSKKYRRTSNFSGPHKLVVDKDGRRAVPINEASKCYLIPEWLAQARRADTRRWAQQKYAHVPTPALRHTGRSPWEHKFPKERKPSIMDVMRDVAILIVAGLALGEPVFVWVEDAAHFFNQFGYAGEELWKSNLVVSARAGDIAAGGQRFEAGQIVFVSEKRLGFGSFASSNIAQRFSNALTGWTLEEFDVLEAHARARDNNPEWNRWVEERTPLEEVCRRERPKRTREALSDCTQSRLAIMKMFTDDCVAVVVGVQRAVRLIEAWRIVTQEINVQMASEDKRQLGGSALWIGVCLLASIGLVVVPRNKVLRAKDAIQRTLDGRITYGEYRALVGLLEHLRYVTCGTADATSALYHPHRNGGGVHEGPETRVEVIGTMRQALAIWLQVMATDVSAVVTHVFVDSVAVRMERATLIIAASSDAAGDGRGTPGIGGYVHGFYWRVGLAANILALLHITAWETIGACIGILVAARLVGDTGLIAMHVDALLTPYALSAQRSRSVDIQRIIHEMLALPNYRSDIAKRLLLRHLSGTSNLPSDLASRGLWEELMELCEVLHTKPVHVALVDAEIAFLVRVVQAAARERGQAFDENELRAGVMQTAPSQMVVAITPSPPSEPTTRVEQGEGEQRQEREARRHNGARGRKRKAQHGHGREAHQAREGQVKGPWVEVRRPGKSTLAIATPNARVRADSMHGESVHQGVAADSVAQADYDMASAAIDGDLTHEIGRWRSAEVASGYARTEQRWRDAWRMHMANDENHEQLKLEFAGAKRAWAAEREQLVERAERLSVAQKRIVRLEDELAALLYRAEQAEALAQTRANMIGVMRRNAARLRDALRVDVRVPMLMMSKAVESKGVLEREFVMSNELVDAESMHGESVHQGLAADSVAQADYDMASAVVTTLVEAHVQVIAEHLELADLIPTRDEQGPMDEETADRVLRGAAEALGVVDHGVGLAGRAADLLSRVYEMLIAREREDIRRIEEERRLIQEENRLLEAQNLALEAWSQSLERMERQGRALPPMGAVVEDLTEYDLTSQPQGNERAESPLVVDLSDVPVLLPHLAGLAPATPAPRTAPPSPPPPAQPEPDSPDYEPSLAPWSPQQFQPRSGRSSPRTPDYSPPRTPDYSVGDDLEMVALAAWGVELGAALGLPQWALPPPPPSPTPAAGTSGVTSVMVGNKRVRADARNATSTHLGLAADSIAQADYDMASAGEEETCKICLEDGSEETLSYLRCCGQTLHAQCLRRHVATQAYQDPGSDEENVILSRPRVRCPCCNQPLRRTSTRGALQDTPPAPSAPPTPPDSRDLTQLRPVVGRHRRAPPVHITIEGAVGVGKSTLLSALEERFASEAIVFVPEPVDVWREKGTLARFYDGEMSALEFQLVAVTTLYSLLAQSLADPKVRVVVTERSLRSNLEVFADLNLKGSALVDYKIAFDALEAALPPCPEVMIYLRAEPSCLRQRVQARGRAEEAALGEDFHVALTEAHDRMCARHPRVVVIDAQRTATEVAQAGADAMSSALRNEAIFPGLTDGWQAQVAAGVLRRHDGRLLVTQRENGVWHFPGGKFEIGEAALQALSRELSEEVGITVLGTPEHVVSHDTDQWRVHVYAVTKWDGTAYAREKQPLQWLFPHEVAALDATPSTYAALEVLEAMTPGRRRRRRWGAWIHRMCRWACTIVVGNRTVAAASRHATSVHLGLAADSVAQADYDMASRDDAWRAKPDETAVRSGWSARIGENGLFAAKGIATGTVVARFHGGRMSNEVWPTYCRERGLPVDHAGIVIQRGRQATVLFDANYQGPTSQPQWHLMNHSKLGANCRMERSGGKGATVAWHTIRKVRKGEELVYDYGGNTKEWDDAERKARNSGGPTQTGRPRRHCARSPTGLRWTALAMASMLSMVEPKEARFCGVGTAAGFLGQEVIEHASFVPVWARSSTTPVPTSTTARASTGEFVPVWVRNGTASGTKPTTVSRETRAEGGVGAVRKERESRAREHPYAAPAFGKSRLRTDQVVDAKALARRLASDRTPGRINASLEKLEEMALAVAEARVDGINPRTASKDAFALREWEAYAEIAGFDPNLQSEWTKRFPERENIKLASWLMWRAQRAIPRSRKGAAKPMSIHQNYLALRRVMRLRNVELPLPGVVRETLRGLIRRFIRRYGIETLRPKRVEPVTPAIVKKVVDLARRGDQKICGKRWSLEEHTCFVVTTWEVANLSLGTRKGESTKLPGDVDSNDWFNRASVTLDLNGRTIVDPTEKEWLSMVDGRDKALLAPRGSKCDQWGTCHGTEPIILPYHDDELNAAKWIRDLEVRVPVHGDARKHTALFGDEQGRPYSDATFAAYITGSLRAVLGDARAKLLSPHSWRVWLASALRMCGASDARIQAMGRWLNPDSIKIYARMDKNEYATWVDKLMAVKRIDTARTTSLPIMDAADAIAAWGAELSVEKAGTTVEWTDVASPCEVSPAPLARNQRLSVYWTDMDKWFSGTYTTNRIEDADGGGKQRSCCIVYDAVGPWATCSRAQLTYWHCLDDERWEAME